MGQKRFTRHFTDVRLCCPQIYKLVDDASRFSDPRTEGHIWQICLRAKFCFKFGDREAIRYALHLSMLMKENRDTYLCEFIDDCKKVEDKTIGKEFSTEAAKQLSDHHFKTQKLFEIEKFYLGN